MSIHVQTTQALTADELISLGKEAAHLAETSGLTLSESCVEVIGHRKLSSEQVRRVVEKANIESFHRKYASAGPGDRYITFDGGPADPVLVSSQLASRQNLGGLGGLNTGLDDYDLPPSGPEIKTSSADPVIERHPRAVMQEVIALHEKLKHAHTNFADEVAATQWRLEDALRDLGREVKTAARAGATRDEVWSAWVAVHPGMARSVFPKVAAHLHQQAAKVAGRSIDPDHSLVTTFRRAAAETEKLAELRNAVRNIEQEMLRVGEWFDKVSAGERAGGAIKWIAGQGLRGGKGVVDLGGGVAAGALGEGARGAGKALTAAGGLYGGYTAASGVSDFADRKIQEFRLRHGLY